MSLGHKGASSIYDASVRSRNKRGNFIRQDSYKRDSWLHTKLRTLWGSILKPIGNRSSSPSNLYVSQLLSNYLIWDHIWIIFPTRHCFPKKFGSVLWMHFDVIYLVFVGSKGKRSSWWSEKKNKRSNEFPWFWLTLANSCMDGSLILFLSRLNSPSDFLWDHSSWTNICGSKSLKFFFIETVLNSNKKNDMKNINCLLRIVVLFFLYHSC